MDWTKILADAGIPEPPGRQEIVEQLAFLKEAAAFKPNPDTLAAIKAAEGVLWLELVNLINCEYKGKVVVCGDIMDRLIAYGGAKYSSDKVRSSVWATVKAKRPRLLTRLPGTGPSVNPNNRGHRYDLYQVES
jgi:hypothetical protein